ncbi:MAG: CBS domain-containing protein [Desulfobulbaceae bacterium]|uniref:CBS domain-containing protein n=1 Tax=Candidatus Desulfatifera sulfidica TaxID=2841691 RepID=A0A8J6N8L9_9BACT|nr:CBS domain-containing protein [Candidatus Desulfatifera sulfidica]
MSIEKKEIVRARDVMDQKLVFVDGMATAAEAAAMMREEHVLSLLVEKRNPDDVWGIIVVQDIIREVLVTTREASEVNVYEIMSKPVVTVPGDMDIRYAARLLLNAGVRRAPVEEQGELVGMLSLSSLVLNNRLF